MPDGSPSAGGAGQGDGAPALSQTIGRYEIVRELGRGTMGIVYEARDTVLARTVALKTIDDTIAAAVDRRDEFERRFFAEARTAARLSHPGIVVCHDVGKDAASGTLFIVLEYLKGRTLGERIKASGAIPWRRAVAIIAKVVRAIGHAHKNGVVHRDLKPPNIMLLESGEPKIMDFGIAKVETARLKLTAMGQSMGSPLYMSPEQALGNDTDARTDIFSLGSVLCTMILGRHYFAAPNIPGILTRIIREEPPELSSLVAGVPQSLDRVLARAMAKSLDERYPTAEQMAEDLEDVLESRPLRHAGQTPLERAEGTMASALDRESLLDGLTHAPAAARDLSDPFDALGSLVDDTHPERPSPAQASGPPQRADQIGGWELRLPATPRARAGAVALTVGVVAIVVVSLLVALFLVWRRSTPSRPDASHSADSAGTTSAKPAPMVSSGAEREEPQPAVGGAGPAQPDGGMSGLHLVVKHRVKNGRLRLFIDDKLAYEIKLRAKGTKKLFVTIRDEVRIEQTIVVEPGKHEVRVAVSWDDNEQTETRSADFKAGATEELEAKLGGLAGTGIKKDLSLEWK